MANLITPFFKGYNSNFYQQQPQQNQNPAQNENTNSKSTTKIPRFSKNSSGGEEGSRKGELAPQDPDTDLEYQKFLLKDLKPEDFVMETPLAAYFTLFFGE